MMKEDGTQERRPTAEDRRNGPTKIRRPVTFQISEPLIDRRKPSAHLLVRALQAGDADFEWRDAHETICPDTIVPEKSTPSGELAHDACAVLADLRMFGIGAEPAELPAAHALFAVGRCEFKLHGVARLQVEL
jgi:hypothetical protein